MDWMVMFRPSAFILSEIAFITGSLMVLSWGTLNQDSTMVIVTGLLVVGVGTAWGAVVAVASAAGGWVAVGCGVVQAARIVPAVPMPNILIISRREILRICFSPSQSSNPIC
jgi:hypothetical protein